MGNSTSPPRQAFAERLARAPLLLDGAMGTLLFSRGVPQRTPLDELVASRPE
jgi:methionine synthase I (cobalamin-dependent)